MKRILIFLGAAVLIGIALFLVLRNKGSELKYRTEKVVRGDIIEAVTATGTVNAVTTVLVGTQVSGTIKHIYVDFNSPVKKGQLIAQIDPSTFEAQVEAAKAQVAQTEAALKYAETNLRYTRILSPVDGIVVSRNVDVGQTVAASFQTPTLFNIAQDLTKMQIDTNVDEADIGKIKVGQDVEFTVDAYPDITFKGRVSQVRIAPIIVQNVVTYDVVIRVDNPEIKLKPGMTANVSIIVAGKNDVLKIHNAALRFRPPETGKPSVFKGTGVWILENGKPRRIEVTTGISDGNYTEIVSGQLKEGQEIIVESITKAKGGRAPSTPTFFR